MQQRYWDIMVQLKFCLYYYQRHFCRYVTIDRWIRIIVGLATAGVVANWSIWENHKDILAYVVIFQQFVVIVSEYLPYKKRVTDLSKMRAMFQKVYREMENKWFDVQNGILSENEINSLLCDFRTRWEDIESSYLTDDALPECQITINKANKQTNRYFGMFYEGGNASGE